MIHLAQAYHQPRIQDDQTSIQSSGRRFCFLLILCFAFFVVGAIPLLACKLPVFRYALERWPVDQYRLVALVNDPDSPAVKDALAILNDLKSQQTLNAKTEIVNLAQLTEEQWWQYEGLEGGPKNQLQVYFPASKQNERLGWTGELTAAAVQRWTDSPIRKALVSDLSDGVSAVWLLVEGENPENNQRVEEGLKNALDQANQTIVIPDGVIRPDEAADYFRDNPGASMDDVLRCSVPLRVDFRLRRLDIDDPNEVALVAMLRALGVRGNRPWLVPVFGRGRMLDAIPTDPLDANVILNACQYMVGECSCTVKAQNPGVDLLMEVDWKSKLGVESLVIGTEQQASPMLLDVPQGKPGTNSQDSLGSTVPEASNRPTATLDQSASAPAAYWSILKLSIVCVAIAFSIGWLKGRWFGKKT